MNPLQIGTAAAAAAALAAVLFASAVLRGRDRRRPRGIVQAQARDAALERAGAPARPDSDQTRSAQTQATPLSSTGTSERPGLTGEQALHQLYALALDAPAPAAATPTVEQEDVSAAVRWTLSNVAGKPKYAPRRPLLLPRLVQAMRDDDVSRRELARIISSDPALAGNLMRLANGAYYRISAEPVESIDRAVALLGTDGMRSLISLALLQPVFRGAEPQIRRFAELMWQHSLRSAQAAEAHAAIVENSDPFAAQLLALVMGLATLVVFRVTLDEYASRALEGDPATITTLIESDTGRVARQTAASWELSERMLVALDEQAPQVLESTRSPLGRSLQFGRLLGALALLREREAIDDEQIKLALRRACPQTAAAERIWTRLMLQSPA